ncbi:MAG: pyridoxal phosphate-dependent aminotransferase [Lachnospiraceae bacterium]|nr:pyridoxal phosphate-dependent aminotransferase [Lachnospiraceae bacterium]
MKYDFDKIINRTNTNSEKYDFADEWGVPKDALPMWVADMDFQTAPCIIEAMHENLNLGIFGYSEPKEEYYDALTKWYRTHFDFNIQKEWVLKTPGVVFGIAVALRALTNPGDAVLIQQPVYYPFRSVIVDNKRKLVNSPLMNRNGYYEMDFTDLEEKIVKNNVKLFILCSPHNPVGRVWKEEELKRVLEICKKHSVFIISDEIHADFTYPGHPHTVFGKIAGDYLEQVIICTSPSKTFNLAGLQISNIVIPSESVRRKCKEEMKAVAYDEVGMLAITACRAAYENGGEWLEELLVYLQGNVDYVRNFLKENLPKVKLIEPEGTYLVWLDFTAYGLTAKELDHKMLNEAKLWLDAGNIFGKEGAGYERVNIACPRSVLKEALERMKKAFA